MNKLWKHYANWQMPVKKDHLLYDSIYTKYQIGTSTETEESWLPGTERGGRLLMGMGFLLGSDKNLLNLGGVDGCTILWIY